MRIDYSEPKKSYSSPQPASNRPRKESSSGGTLLIVFITALLTFGIGFGAGWTLSQRSAKKAFKAAMEQQSLENTPKQNPAQQPSPQHPASAAPVPVTPQQPATGNTPPQPAPTGNPSAASDPPLSFYKTLPSGQKSTVLGSGINTKDEKTQKQPLQAVMPSNIARPAAAQSDDATQKQPAQPSAGKQAARPDAAGLTIQVASFSLKSEAETLRNKLAAKGYNVNIAESHLGDKGTWYRVRVGRRLDPDAARELAGKLGKGAIVIPDKE